MKEIIEILETKCNKYGTEQINEELFVVLAKEAVREYNAMNMPFADAKRTNTQKMRYAAYWKPDVKNEWAEMVTKQELEQYRSIVAEIDEVRERLNSNIVSDTVVGSDIHYPFTSHVMRVEGVADKASAERDKKLLRHLEEQKQSIEEFVSDIPDSLTRRIFRLRYISGSRQPSWVKVSMDLGGGNTKGSVQKRHERFLKDL